MQTYTFVNEIFFYPAKNRPHRIAIHRGRITMPGAGDEVTLWCNNERFSVLFAKKPQTPQRDDTSLSMDMRDIAKIAGVSSATVSRVINGSKLVRPATTERVQRV